MRLTNPLTETADAWRQQAAAARQRGDDEMIKHSLAVALAWETEAARAEAEELIAAFDEDDEDEEDEDES